MSLSTVASITLSVISLTAFILFAYDKIESEFFQTYKAPLFLGSAFLVFAILGLPYMSYDATIAPPSFQFTVLGFAAVFVLGTLLVFTTNLTYETYIMAISSIAILTTLFGKIGSGSDSEISPLAQKILYLTMSASILYGSSVGLSRMSIPPEIEPYIRFYIGIVPVLLWGILAGGLFVVFRGIAESAASQPAYPTKAAFEPFQASLAQEMMKTPILPVKKEAPKPPVQKVQAILRPTDVGTTVPVLLEQIQAAIERIQNNTELILDQTDTTCSIVNDVEQGYIAAKAAPADDDFEYSLPKDVQEKRKTFRQDRAKASFAENRRVYASLQNSVFPMLECFQTDIEVDVDSEDDIDLREACKELETLLANQDVLLQAQKASQVWMALSFSNKQLDRIEEDFQSSSSVLATLRGPALILAAQQLLIRELTLTIGILRNTQAIKGTKDRINKELYKGSMVQNGNYNVTPQELKDHGFSQ